MKLFEIINNTWIKQTGFHKFRALQDSKRIYNALKISEISSIQTHQTTRTDKQHQAYSIALGAPDGSMILEYDANEKEEYEADLKFLEGLLFGQ